MQGSNTRWLRPALAAALAGLWLAAGASADTIIIKSGTSQLTISDAKITRIENDQIFFTTATHDTEDSKPVSSVIKIELDDEPAFSAAEDAYSTGDWKTAAADYSKALSATSRDWVKSRSSVRLMEAATNSGDFAAGVSGFLAMADRDPGLAAQHRPVIPTDKPADIDSGISLVKNALDSSDVKPEEQKVLLPFLANLYTAKGDLPSADGALDQLAKIDPAAANSPLVVRARAGMKIAQANTAITAAKFQDAENLIESNSALFVDPSQQADALYILAEAKEGLARDNSPDSLKDAAIAYMRLVGDFKDQDGTPHVADAMMKTAALEEKMQKPDDALTLYRQIADKFKGTPQGQQADQNAQRLQAARATH